jgi:hypothetical protein
LWKFPAIRTVPVVQQHFSDQSRSTQLPLWAFQLIHQPPLQFLAERIRCVGAACSSGSPSGQSLKFPDVQAIDMRPQYPQQLFQRQFRSPDPGGVKSDQDAQVTFV